MRLLIFIFAILGVVQSQRGCRTNLKGPEKNRACQFPFKWGGKTHYSCVKDRANGGRPWCSTFTDSEGEHIHGRNLWGWCGRDCEVSNVESWCINDNICWILKAKEVKTSWRQWSNSCQGRRPRIRKEVNTLTNEEQRILQNALKKAINNPHPTNGQKFQDIAAYHGAPFGLCGNQNCCPHGSNGQYETFLTWHRLYLLQLEELLEPYLKGTNLGLPYWDWTLNANVPTLWENILSPIKDPEHPSFQGTCGKGCYYHMYGNGDSPMSQCKNEVSDNTFAMRATNAHNKLRGKEGDLSLEVFDARGEGNFREFSKRMSWAHGTPHNDLKCTMKGLYTAAYDPVFWMHHGYIDKVFAEWQHDCGLRRWNIRLDNSKIPRPFGPEYRNPFDITQKTQQQTWDYERDLCYTYDEVKRKSSCKYDISQDRNTKRVSKWVFAPKATCADTKVPIPLDKCGVESMYELEEMYGTNIDDYDECIDNITNDDIENLCCQRKNGTEYIQNPDISEEEYNECISKCGYINFEVCNDDTSETEENKGEKKDYERFYIVKSYVAVVLPKQSGSLSLPYSVCYDDGNCQNSELSVFTPINPNATLDKIDSTFYAIQQNLLSGNGSNIYDQSQWKSLDITGEKDFIPIETPPLIVIEGTNGKEEFKIAHLQQGVDKEAYADLLDSYEVKDYCDFFSFFEEDFKLGAPSVCGWSPEELKAELPKTEETE